MMMVANFFMMASPASNVNEIKFALSVEFSSECYYIYKKENQKHHEYA